MSGPEKGLEETLSQRLEILDKILTSCLDRLGTAPTINSPEVSESKVTEMYVMTNKMIENAESIGISLDRL